MTNTEEGFESLEWVKLFADYFKHLTTLSTGSVLLMATLLEKLFQKPELQFLVPISFLGFVLSIIASMIAILILIATESKIGPTGGKAEAFGLTVIFTALGGFLTGILSLAAFGLWNFL